MADGLDRGLRAELLAEATDADLHDVGAWIEVVAPDLGEQALAADDLSRVLDEMMEQAKLPVGKVGDHGSDARLSPCDIEDERAGFEDVPVTAASRPAELNADPRDQLVERERLRQVVARAEPEPAQLRLQVGPGRHDHHREIGPPALELLQNAQTVGTGQEQVEDDE